MTPKQRYEPNFLLEVFSNPLDPGYADAAAARAERGPRPAWARRTARALRVVALLVIGFLLAVAWRQALAAEPDRSSAHAGLVDEVKAAQARTDDLQHSSDDLRRDVAAQQEAALGGASEELRKIRMQEAATGLAPVTGDGAVVTVTDALGAVDPTTGRASTTNTSKVLDVDLQAVVNGLWAGGAEAVAINGQRLTATSTIRTAGDAVLVDFRPVTSPYQVAAIGPSDLDDRFNQSPTAANLRAVAEQYGLGLSVRAADDLTLPAATSATLRYAQPAKGAGG